MTITLARISTTRIVSGRTVLRPIHRPHCFMSEYVDSTRIQLALMDSP